MHAPWSPVYHRFIVVQMAFSEFRVPTDKSPAAAAAAHIATKSLDSEHASIALVSFLTIL